jgi:uncharacterized protein
MMTIRGWYIATIVTVMSVPPLSGQAIPAPDSARVETVQRLFALTRVESYHEQITQMALDRYAQVPALTQFAETTREFFAKHLTFAAIEADLIAVHREYYTEAEVQEMIRFYESPIGQRLTVVTPLLTARLNQVMVERMNALLPDLLLRLGVPPPGV